MFIIQYSYSINDGDYDLDGMIAVGDEREAERVTQAVMKAADVFGFSGTCHQRSSKNIRFISPNGEDLDQYWDEVK